MRPGSTPQLIPVKLVPSVLKTAGKKIKHCKIVNYMHMTRQMRLTFVSSDGLREMRQLNLLSKGIFFENSL
jgi:hypothetical protein